MGGKVVIGMSSDTATVQESEAWADGLGVGRDRLDEFWERIRMSAQWTLKNRECSQELRELLHEIATHGANAERSDRWWELGEHTDELFRFTPGVLELAAEIADVLTDEDTPDWVRFPELFGPPADVETETIEVGGEKFEATNPPLATGESRTLPVKLYHIDDLPVLYRGDGLCQQGYRCPTCGRWVVFSDPHAMRECSDELVQAIDGDPEDGSHVYHCADAIVFVPFC